MGKSLIKLLFPNFPPTCAVPHRSQVTPTPATGVLTSIDIEFVSLSFLLLSASLATLSASEELLGLFEGVPSLCELFFYSEECHTTSFSPHTSPLTQCRTVADVSAQPSALASVSVVH